MLFVLLSLTPNGIVQVPNKMRNGEAEYMRTADLPVHQVVEEVVFFRGDQLEFWKILITNDESHPGQEHEITKAEHQTPVRSFGYLYPGGDASYTPLSLQVN